MISNPRPGQLVVVHYAAKVRAARPLHGRIGVVVAVSKGKPRNHGVEIGGQVYSIPAGNLRPFAPKPCEAAAAPRHPRATSTAPPIMPR